MGKKAGWNKKAPSTSTNPTHEFIRGRVQLTQPTALAVEYPWESVTPLAVEVAQRNRINRKALLR